MDGKLEATGTPTTDTVSSGELRFGLSLQNDQGFKGIVDEIAIFNVDLTEDDIKSIMAKGSSSALAVSPAGKLTATWGLLRIR